MSSNLQFLSNNLMTILQEMGTSQNLCKYLEYDTKQPTTGTDIADTSTLLLNKLWPMPFDETIETADCSQVRVYYSSLDTENNMVVTDMIVFFDIIVAKSLWLINESDNSPSIRPYSIANEIIKTFRNNSVGTVGKILFKKMHHMAVNKQFDAIRLTAKVVGFSSGV